MQLLVPRQHVEWTESIQQCLLVAKQHGFATDAVTLGVSPMSCFQLQAENSSLMVTSDLIADVECCNSTVDLNLRYNHEYCVDSLSKKAKRTIIPTSNIYIGLDDNDGLLDVWQHQGETRALQYPSRFNRSPTQHFAWVLTLLSLEFPIEDALTFARAQLNVSRETWANDFYDFPIPLLEDGRLGVKVGWAANACETTFPTINKQDLGLYPVVDCVEWIEKLLEIGITTTQLRIKDPQTPDLEAQIARAIELGKQYSAQVFINDYWQLAIKYGAYGVHLGQEDIEESNLTQLANAGICLGLSTHGYYELLRIIQINPSYIALGHIFPTTTKQMPSKPQGLVRLAHYQKLIDSIPYNETQLSGYPTVAIGGIDLGNAQQVWDCGVSSLAVVRAMTLASNPREVKAEFDLIMQPTLVANQELCDVE